MEDEKKTSALSEVNQDVNEALRQLERGETREASAIFARAKNLLVADKDETREVLDLEKDLQAQQAGNLVTAQNNFYFRNVRAGSSGAAALQSDSVVAGKQWAKLQEAQEVLSAHLQPLRVNLPLRGLHFTFNQVLQTETGKPITIQFSATLIRSASGWHRLSILSFAFVTLWAAVAFARRVLKRGFGPTFPL